MVYSISSLFFGGTWQTVYPTVCEERSEVLLHISSSFLTCNAALVTSSFVIFPCSEIRKSVNSYVL